MLFPESLRDSFCRVAITVIQILTDTPAARAAVRVRRWRHEWRLVSQRQGPVGPAADWRADEAADAAAEVTLSDSESPDRPQPGSVRVTERAGACGPGLAGSSSSRASDSRLRWIRLRHWSLALVRRLRRGRVITRRDGHRPGAQQRTIMMTIRSIQRRRGF